MLLVYLLPNVCFQLVCNRDTMHGKCRLLRFKIIIIQVMGPCNLIGEYHGFGQNMLPPSSNCM
jgi:hypothetical protein